MMFDYFIPDLRTRSVEEELMDRVDIDIEKLLSTVKQFGIFNAHLSRSRTLIRKGFFSSMKKEPGKNYAICDIGTGGADIPLWIAKKARRLKLRIQITAIDRDVRLLPVAKKAACRYPEIRLVTHDARELHQLGEFDFIFSNHFLHHLERSDLGNILSQVEEQARLGFIMNDIHRTNWAYAVFTILASGFKRKSLAFYDGRLSIKRGFTKEELIRLIERACPDSGIRVRTAWPSRIIVARP
jgi:2-polyprenyl-3-methyl-5-hydroxy-6-metoxy-1,4-benzoquinol methylase